jgi:hypothetical protein
VYLVPRPGDIVLVAPEISETDPRFRCAAPSN